MELTRMVKMFRVDAGIRLLKGFGYDIVLFMSLFGIFFFSALCYCQPSVSLFFKIFSAIGDASLLTLISSLLKGKAKLFTCTVSFVVLVLTMVNVVYFRYFGDLLPSSLYRLDGIDDPTVVSNAFNGFRLYDIIPLFLACFPAGYLIVIRRRLAGNKPALKSSSMMRGLLLSVCIVSWGVTMAGTFRRQKLYHHCETAGQTLEYVFPDYSVDWMFFYNNHNFTGYLIKILANLGDGTEDLTEDDLQFIRSHIRYDGPKITVGRDSAPSDLVFIVVESLPYSIITRNDTLLTPNLCALAGMPDAIVKKCEVLAKYGRSSDAQFIYNTGLLPLRNEPLVTKFAYNDYPSLAKALNMRSVEVIGENPKLWSHAVTTKSYGFSSLVSDVAENRINQDSLIFQKALEEVRKTDATLFLFITTLSMHNPYTSQNVTDEVPGDVLASDARDMEYYSRLHHFDRSLGEFISGLKASGRYGNSLIVIAGDHPVSETDVSSALWDKSVPLVILNSPLCCDDSIECTQLDIFPTLLDAMGADCRYLGVDYRGLGESLFRNRRSGKNITEESYRASELIIRSKVQTGRRKN